MNQHVQYASPCLRRAFSLLLYLTVLAAAVTNGGCTQGPAPQQNQATPPNQNAGSTQSQEKPPPGEPVGEREERTFDSLEDFRKFFEDFKRGERADKPIIISGGSLEIESQGEVTFDQYIPSDGHHVLTHPNTGHAKYVFMYQNVYPNPVVWYKLPPGNKTSVNIQFAGEDPFLQLDPFSGGRLVLKCPNHSFKDDFEPKGKMDTNIKRFASDQKKMPKIVLVTDVWIQDKNTGQWHKPKIPHPHHIPVDRLDYGYSVP